MNTHKNLISRSSDLKENATVYGCDAWAQWYVLYRFGPCVSCVTQGSGKMQSGLSFSDSDVSFTPLVVLELADDTKTEAITWFLNRIRDKQQNGGETPCMIYQWIELDRNWMFCEISCFLRLYLKFILVSLKFWL